MEEMKSYGPLLLRISIAALFLYTGITKLMNPTGPITMLSNLGFPAPTLLAWILLLSEIIFGLAVLVGWRLKYTVWPLIIILLVAIYKVSLPNANGNYVNLLFHILGIAALLSLSRTGPGKYSIE